MTRRRRPPSPRRPVTRRLVLEVLEDRSVPALVAAYGFDEAGGATATDLSGTGNAGTISGATRIAAGRYGGALRFDGVNDLVTINDANSLDLTTGMTLEAWVRPTALGGWTTAVMKERAGGLAYSLYASDDAGRPPAGYINRNGTDVAVTGTAALPLGAWSHLAVTYDGANLTLFVNAVPVATRAQTGATATSSNPLRIGGNTVWGEYFAGDIDEVRVYNNALTQAQIQADMDTPLTGGPPADTTPPTVTAITPRMGAVNVTTSGNVTATFNEALSAATVTSATVELRDPSGALVPAAVSYDAATRTATLDPASNLVAGPGYYTARVRGGASGVKDAAGNALAADFSWSFTTGTWSLQEATAFAGLTNPTVVEFAPDGRVFIAEKSGLIKVYDNLQDTTATIFADLRTKVHNYWDRGLLGMTLHPDFANNPYVYVLYTHDAPIGGTAPAWGTPGGTGDPGPGTSGNGPAVSGRLSRLRVGAGGAWDGVENVLVEDWGNQYPSHSIGTVAFGADGYLYASGGDGASFTFADVGQVAGSPPVNLGDPANEGGAARSQDLRTPADPTSLDGSVIRIDPVTGLAVPTNPLFASGTDENARRIIAHGLRNPFRFAVRPGTSEVWLGDVGWNEWEEINRVADPLGAVENFGWPAYEGPNRQTSYDNLNVPILENLYAAGPAAHNNPYYAYRHSEQVVAGSGEPTGSSAIAGLAFAQGSAMPAGFSGALFFTDYNRDTIWVLYRGLDGLPDTTNRALFYRSSANALDAVNLKVGPDGLIYFPDFDSGTVRRLSFLGSNRPPNAVIQASATAIPPGQSVQFDGRGSTDPDNDPLAYAWDLDGDGQFDDSTLALPSFTYTTAGSYNVGLRVTDTGGLSDEERVTIIVGNRPTARIDTPTAGVLFQANAALSFAGGGTDVEDGTLPASALSWTFSFYQADEQDPNNINLRNRQVFAGVSSGSYTLPDWEYPVFLVIDLTATDSTGLQHTQSLRVEPQTVSLNFDTDPDGLQLSLNGRTRAAPFARTLVVNSLNQISVATPQVLAGTTYNFSSWSDGGAVSHFITAPATTATYTASFTAAPAPTGLVAAYGFEENAGSTTADASGNGHTGTLSNAAWTTSGRFGNALTFNGTNAWVTVADSNLLDLTTGFTLEAWVYPTAVSADWRTVLLKERPGGLAYALYATDGANRPPAGYVNNGADRSAVGTTTLPVNTWAHLAVTYGGGNLRLYVDGNLVRTTAVSGSAVTSAGVLRLGGNGVWGEYFSGRLDEVRLYSRALSQAEIQADMTRAVGGGGGQVAGLGGQGLRGAGGATGAAATGAPARGDDGVALLLMRGEARSAPPAPQAAPGRPDERFPLLPDGETGLTAEANAALLDQRASRPARRVIDRLFAQLGRDPFGGAEMD